MLRPIITYPMISLLAFVQTGRLGDIGLGATRKQVEQAFGPPHEWATPLSRERSPIWKYGDVEIYFEGDLVWMIFADDFDALLMGEMPFDASGISGQINCVQMEQWFDVNGLAFKRTHFSYCDEGVRFETNSGVIFTFCAEEIGATAFLSSFFVSRR